MTREHPKRVRKLTEKAQAYISEHYQLKASNSFKVNQKFQKSGRAVSAAAKTQHQKASEDAGTKQLSINQLEKAVLEEEGDAPTDIKDSAGPRKGHIRHHPDAHTTNGHPTSHILESLEREMTYLVKSAKRVTFKDFNFAENCKSKTTDIPEGIIDWDDNCPHIAVSADGIEIAAYFPNAVKPTAQKMIVQDLYDFAAIVPPSVHKTKMSQNKPDGIYKKVPDQLHGEHRLARGWHALGQKGIDKFGPCADTVKNFNAVMKLKFKLQLLFHRVNVLMKTLDPTHYQDAQELKKHLIDMHPAYASLAQEDILVYDGLEVLWNVWSQLHCDRQDPTFSWAALCIFGGTFTGGKLCLPNVGLRVRMQPGDIIFIKGRVLRHYIEEWTGGQRISIPIFTHTSVWKMVKELVDRLQPDEATGDD